MADNKKEPICPYAGIQHCSPPQDNEINLLDIWNVLWGQRTFIAAITIIVACVSLAYAFFSKEIYVTKVEITPLHNLQTPIIQELKGVQNDFKLPTSDDVFSSVYNNLTNLEMQEQYWKEIVLAGKLISEKSPVTMNNVSKESFIQNLKFKIPKGKSNKVQQVTAILSGHNPEITAELLNNFLSYVDKFTGRSISEDLKVQLDNRKMMLENNIETQLNINEQIKLAKIVELNDAIMIAEKLGLNNLPENVSELPLYARGVKALQIERDVLQKSGKKDDFDKNLIVIESQLANLNKINFDKVDISTFQINYVPPEKQNQRPLIVLFLGVIAGFVLAVFMVFLKNFLLQIKK